MSLGTHAVARSLALLAPRRLVSFSTSATRSSSSSSSSSSSTATSSPTDPPVGRQRAPVDDIARERKAAIARGQESLLATSPPDRSSRPKASPTGEVDGPRGPEPTRYGDWERKGRCIDF